MTTTRSTSTITLALTPSQANELVSALHRLTRDGVGGERMRVLAYAVIRQLIDRVPDPGTGRRCVGCGCPTADCSSDCQSCARRHAARWRREVAR